MTVKISSKGCHIYSDMTEIKTDSHNHYVLFWCQARQAKCLRCNVTDDLILLQDLFWKLCSIFEAIDELSF